MQGINFIDTPPTIVSVSRGFPLFGNSSVKFRSNRCNLSGNSVLSDPLRVSPDEGPALPRLPALPRGKTGSCGTEAALRKCAGVPDCSPSPPGLSHGALLQPRGLPTGWCVVDRAGGDHRAAKPPTHTISTSTAGRHRRSVYRGAIVLTSFNLVLEGMQWQKTYTVLNWQSPCVPCAPSPLCPCRERGQQPLVSGPSPPVSSCCRKVHFGL